MNAGDGAAKWNAEKCLSLIAYPRNTAGGSTASLCCVFLASVSMMFLRVFIALDMEGTRGECWRRNNRNRNPQDKPFGGRGAHTQ